MSFRFYCIFLFFLLSGLGFTGVFNFIGLYFDCHLFRMMKEIVLFVICSISIIYLFLNKSRIKFNVLHFVSILGFVIIIFSSLKTFSVSNNIMVILYQYKLDAINAITALIFSLVISKLDKFKIIDVHRGLKKVILFLLVINIFFALVEISFPTGFMSILGRSFGNWGNDDGIKVISAYGSIRPIGLLTNFTDFGTLCLFGFLYFSYYPVKYNKSLLTLILVGVYISTFKTAYIGVVFFIILNIFSRIVKNKKVVVYIACFLFVSVFFIVFNFNLLNISSISSHFLKKVYFDSVFLRVFIHQEVISEFKSLTDLIFGLGFGVNGIYSGYGEFPKYALDSTYIYIFSNYGLLGIVSILFLVSLSYFYVSENNFFVNYLYMFIIIFCIMFFENNIIVLYPVFLLLLIGSYLSIRYQSLNNQEVIFCKYE